MRSTNSLSAGRVVFAILTGYIALAIGAQGANSKIDGELRRKFAASATAPVGFVVVLRERASLTLAPGAAGRGAHAREVVRSLRNVASASQAGVRDLLTRRGARFTPFWIENAVYVPDGDLQLAEELAGRAEVSAIVAEPVFQVPKLRRDAAAGVRSSGTCPGSERTGCGRELKGRAL